MREENIIDLSGSSYLNTRSVLSMPSSFVNLLLRQDAKYLASPPPRRTECLFHPEAIDPPAFCGFYPTSVWSEITSESFDLLFISYHLTCRPSRPRLLKYQIEPRTLSCGRIRSYIRRSFGSTMTGYSDLLYWQALVSEYTKFQSQIY
jgi:hypothetical protein